MMLFYCGFFSVRDSGGLGFGSGWLCCFLAIFWVVSAAFVDGHVHYLFPVLVPTIIRFLSVVAHGMVNVIIK